MAVSFIDGCHNIFKNTEDIMKQSYQKVQNKLQHTTKSFFLQVYLKYKTISDNLQSVSLLKQCQITYKVFPY
jgi:hypothetical protein